jgi:NAD(P) transhydrogenase subunit alpha
MRAGTVLVDLAAAGGGNCELTQPGETQRLNGVTLFAPLNLATGVPGHASQLYSRNITNFLALIVKDGALQLNFEDEILSGSCVAREGKVVNPRVASALEATAGKQTISQ